MNPYCYLSSLFFAYFIRAGLTNPSRNLITGDATTIGRYCYIWGILGYVLFKATSRLLQCFTVFSVFQYRLSSKVRHTSIFFQHSDWQLINTLILHYVQSWNSWLLIPSKVIAFPWDTFNIILLMTSSDTHISGNSCWVGCALMLWTPL